MVAFTFWKRMNRFWCQLLTVVHEAAPLTRVRLATSRALQSQKWQLIRMSQWYRSALCGHPSPALTDNLTHGAASRHTIAPISHTRPSPEVHNSWATTHFPSRWGQEAELAWARSRLATCSRLLAVNWMWVEPVTFRLRVQYSTTTTAGWLVAWHSGRTSVSNRRTFAVLRSTCGWRVTTYVGKPSAVGQPTRPTHLFLPFGVDKWVVGWN